MRAGGTALSLLARPGNARVLRALSGGKRSSARLRAALGSPPHDQLSRALRSPTRLGLLERSQRGAAAGIVDYDLTPAGKELLRVGEAADAWLASRPRGATELGSPEAQLALHALNETWARITADEGRVAPSDWLRRGVAPLAAGAAWERRHLPARTAPITRSEVEAAFLLCVPLVRLRPERSGTARLAVELPRPSANPILAGVLITVADGEIAHCTPRLAGQVTAMALGGARAWLTAVIDGDISGLKLDGDEHFATELVWAIHSELFGGV